ncbi:MAG TPA: XRE family transcriptional regulator [Arenibaculum sp.]|nr:XRE family transcriptional regulator [Arenibaculum sp.]
MLTVRKALYDWMACVLDERGWSAAAWARHAEVTPTNLTRFLRDPKHASLPSAETIGRLAWAAGSEPRFLDQETAPPPTRVPVLRVAQLRALRQLGPRQAEEFLDELRLRTEPCVLYDRDVTRRAFALRVTTMHMNAGGLVPDDIVVLEPVDVAPPSVGDLVATVDGDHVCAYRWYHPLLVPTSTESACKPVSCDDVAVVGVAVHLIRALRD